MLSKKIAVVLAFVFFACIVKADGDVLSLTSLNFDSEISKHDISLVKFFAPWCGYCNQLAPEFEKAASELKTNDPPIALFEVDCSAEKDLCEKFDINGIPAMIFFHREQVIGNYNGPRNATGIVESVNEQVLAKLNAIKQLYENIIKSVEANAGDKKVQGVKEQVIEKASEKAHDIKDQATGVKEQVAEKVQAVKNKISGEVNDKDEI